MAEHSLVYIDRLGDQVEVTKMENGDANLSVKSKRTGWAQTVNILADDVEPMLINLAAKMGVTLVNADDVPYSEGPE